MTRFVVSNMEVGFLLFLVGLAICRAESNETDASPQSRQLDSLSVGGGADEPPEVEYKEMETTKKPATKKVKLTSAKGKGTIKSESPVESPDFFDVKCVECNSYINPDSCGDDWDRYSHIVSCRNLSNIDPTRPQLCSTIRQTVKGEFRVIRYCTNKRAASKIGCIDRVGTHNIKITYCTCEGDMCNESPSRSPALGVLIVMCSIFVFGGGII